MSIQSVLRIGPSGSESAKLLKTTLLEYFDSQNGREISVQNRYFQASISLLDVDDNEEPKDVAAKEDGIILAFDDDFDGGFKVESAGELLRLCVEVSRQDNKNKQGKEYEDEYSKRVLWCLDRQFEYVEATINEKSIQQGHEDRDKEGFARIVEAISGTVWSSAVMDKTKQQAMKKAFVEDYAKAEESEKESKYVPPEQDREAEARAAILRQSNIEETRNEVEEEKKFEQLENALREATRIRDMSRSGELSDEQRRERAADAANLLMSLMGQLDDSDDEEEGEAAS